MRKSAFICLFAIVLLGLCSSRTPAQGRKAPEREPDSEYVEKRDTSKRRGGLFDFLPFVGSRTRKVEPERLEPSPRPQASKPVLLKGELEQLRGAAEKWVLGSEHTEPTVRQDENGRHYRDYIVFANEYEAKVLRGQSDEVPFIGHIYIKGDYFKTRSHEMPEGARADFKFSYQTREFRVIFDRTEKWEYSDDPAEEPFMFVERWEFQGLQSRPVVNLSHDLSSPFSSPEEMEKAPPPQPEGE